jgi:hypothetical protein
MALMSGRRKVLYVFSLCSLLADDHGYYYLQAEGTATTCLVSEALQAANSDSDEKQTVDNEDAIMQVAMVMYAGGSIVTLPELKEVLIRNNRYVYRWC